MRIPTFYTHVIHHNTGVFDQIGNTLLKPMHTLIFATKGDNAIKETAFTSQAKNISFSTKPLITKILQVALSILFIIPSIITGSICKGLARLNPKVRTAYTQFADRLKLPPVMTAAITPSSSSTFSPAMSPSSVGTTSAPVTPSQSSQTVTSPLAQPSEPITPVQSPQIELNPSPIAPPSIPIIPSPPQIELDQSPIVQPPTPIALAPNVPVTKFPTWQSFQSQRNDNTPATIIFGAPSSHLATPASSIHIESLSDEAIAKLNEIMDYEKSYECKPKQVNSNKLPTLNFSIQELLEHIQKCLDESHLSIEPPYLMGATALDVITGSTTGGSNIEIGFCIKKAIDRRAIVRTMQNFIKTLLTQQNISLTKKSEISLVTNLYLTCIQNPKKTTLTIGDITIKFILNSSPSISDQLYISLDK